MTLEAGLVWPFACLFARSSALMLSAPFSSASVPVPVRVGFSAVLSMGMTPVLAEQVGPLPADMYSLAAAIAQNVLVGLLIGFTIQLVVQGLLMAGAFLDMQMGLGSVQVLNPMTETPVSLLAQFKYLLGVVLLLVTDGHHAMLQAFVQSYGAPAPSMDAILEGTMALVTQSALLSIQIAAPVVAVCVVVDAAAGFVNKAIPMMPVYLVSLPAKIMVSIVSLGLALPLLASAVHGGLGRALDTLSRMLGG